MALSVKTALLISLGWITCVSWLLLGASGDRTNVPSPLRTVSLAGVPSLEPAPRELAESPEEWQARFARLSSVEQEHADMRRSNAPAPLTPAPRVVEPPLPPVVADRTRWDGIDEPEPADPPAAQPETLAAADSSGAPDTQAEPPTLSAPAAPVQLRVERGDTLTHIAKRVWGACDARRIELLMAANPELKKRKGRVLAGEMLIIPADAAPAAAASPDSPTTTAVHWYTIQKRDTLTGIAERFLRDGRRWPEIVELNPPLKGKAGRLIPGTKIRLPAIERLARS